MLRDEGLLRVAVLAAACTVGACATSAEPPSRDAAVPGTLGAPSVSGSAGPTLCESAASLVAPTFVDQNLERAVRSALEMGVDEALTCERLASIRSLYAPDARIGSLEGIQSLVGLEVLYVYGNNTVRDVSPLAALSQLRDVSLARNAIHDLGPLASLTSLTSLDLLGNPIRDLGPLAGLTALERLRIAESPEVVDLTPLSGLTGLRWLELDGNSITDLRPLHRLSALTRVSLQRNRELADLRPLAHLGALEILMLGGTATRDLSPLGGLQRLHTLGLEGTQVHDLGPLIGLGNLSRLNLLGNRLLSDIQPLLFNGSLGPGDVIRLERTAVRCEDVGALQRRGVNVLADCR
jgi:hypothetical protein